MQKLMKVLSIYAVCTCVRVEVDELVLHVFMLIVLFAKRRPTV